MGINYEKTMICTLHNVMLYIKQTIYFWYLNKNMLTNYKPSSNIRKIWKEFYNY